jgi:Protein of unknown function (DUF1638)
MRMKVIACRVMIDEMRDFLPADVEADVFEISRHIRPKQLKADLQAAVDRVDGTCDGILLGYGLCSNAVVGLHARKSRIVIPKIHDCIGVFLGSHEAYLDEMQKEPAFFLTQGYIQGYQSERSGPLDELEKVAQRHGRERAEKIVGEMMRPYKRLVYIKTARASDVEADRQYSAAMAARFNLRYEEKPGKSDLLRRLAEGKWESGFVVIEPGHEATLEHFMS